MIRRDELAADLAMAEDVRRAAVDAAQAAVDRLHEIRQARIDGMAAELALRLSEGDPCAVCGSPHHPAPAEPLSEMATADDEEAAQAEADATQAEREEAEAVVVHLGNQHERASDASDGLSPSEAEQAREEAQSDLTELESAAAREPDHRDEVTRLETALAEVRDLAADTALALRDLQTKEETSRAEEDRITVRLSAALDPGETVASRRARLTTEATTIGAALAAAIEATTLSDRLTEAKRQVAAATRGTRLDRGRDVGSLADGSAEAGQVGPEAAGALSSGAGSAGSGQPDPLIEDGDSQGDGFAEAGQSGRVRSSSAGSGRGSRVDAVLAGQGDSPSDGPATTHQAGSAADLKTSALTGDARTGSASLTAGWDPGVWPDAPAAEDLLAEAERVVEELVATIGRRFSAQQAADGLSEEVRNLRARETDDTRLLMETRAARGRFAHEEQELKVRLDRLRGDDDSIYDRVTRLRAETDAYRHAAEVSEALAEAKKELAAARNTALAAAVDAGFTGLDDVAAARRPAAEIDEMGRRLRELGDELAAVVRTLADPELMAAAALPAPDTAALQLAHDEADAARSAQVSTRDRAVARLTQLRSLAGELTLAQERRAPADRRHRLARRMAELANGTSSDNQWDMPLSSYVLGERLRQVADAANERLTHMSDGRYLLQYDVRKTAGHRSRSGGGLGLRVLDAWTGIDRDPATLSGGESFITSWPWPSGWPTWSRRRRAAPRSAPSSSTRASAPSTRRPSTTCSTSSTRCARAGERSAWSATSPSSGSASRPSSASTRAGRVRRCGDTGP